MKRNIVKIISFIIASSISYGIPPAFSLYQDPVSSLSLNMPNNEMIAVLDEPHIFNDPFPFTLNQTNIDPASIVITDVTGLLIFTEGDDYTITEIIDEVVIAPTILGVDLPNIYDGQLLLVDYFYIPEPCTLLLLGLGGLLLRKR